MDWIQNNTIDIFTLDETHKTHFEVLKHNPFIVIIHFSLFKMYIKCIIWIETVNNS